MSYVHAGPAGITPPTVSGDWAGDTTGKNLCVALASMGLIVDSSTNSSTSISLVGAGASNDVGTTATSITLASPAGTQSGDTLYAVVAQGMTSAATPTMTPPASWTLVAHQADANLFTHLWVYSIRLSAAAAANYVWSWTSGSTLYPSGSMIALRLNASASPTDGVTPVGVTGASATGTVGSITPVTNNDWQITAVVGNGAGTITLPALSPAYTSDGSSATVTPFQLAHRGPITPAAAIASQSLTFTSSAAYCTITFVVKPG